MYSPLSSSTWWTRRLMLVCRKWCQLVSSTPSLWRFFGLSLNDPKEHVIGRLKKFSSLIKCGQVELYLYDMHLYQSCPENLHLIEDCASRKETITTIMDSLPRLRKLFVSFESNPAHMNDLTGCWSQAPNIYELVYSIGSWKESLFTMDFPLEYHVRDLPNLSSLSLDNAGNVAVSPPGTHPLLPNLTTLTLGSAGAPLTAYQLTTLLSHCPRLQRLTCTSYHFVEGDHHSLKSFKLRYLTSIEVGRDYLLKIFSSYIETPVLRSLIIEGHSELWTPEFARKNCGIEYLRLSRQYRHGYPGILTHLTKLTKFSLRIHGPGLSLRPLYTTPDILCAESLQHLEIRIWRDELHTEYFEGLVQARFLRANKEGYTAAGCKAMQELVLEVRHPDMALKQVRQSALWKKAKIIQRDPSIFILRWDFEDTAEVC
ncbi:hypothetical protein FS842_008384 [Serendipita sp. 407]|nr:hypothetical protein FRC18_000522 [Serendipita sp. 400]KAG9053307.1 hypothetical protein FS842_008384 [Serendipita sp. 407]